MVESGAATVSSSGSSAGGSSGTYTTYFLAGLSPSFDPATQKASSSALNLNYDFFTANFNSLNKRMGELRDNPYTQGCKAPLKLLSVF